MLMREGIELLRRLIILLAAVGALAAILLLPAIELRFATQQVSTNSSRATARAQSDTLPPCRDEELSLVVEAPGLYQKDLTAALKGRLVERSFGAARDIGELPDTSTHPIMHVRLTPTGYWTPIFARGKAEALVYLGMGTTYPVGMLKREGLSAKTRDGREGLAVADLDIGSRGLISFGAYRRDLINQTVTEAAKLAEDLCKEE